MVKSIIFLETFRAYREYRALGPMTEEEQRKMVEMIPRCPMNGQKFDDMNMLYPLKIPQKPIVHKLSQEEEIFSMDVRFNNTKFVNFVGNMELLECYSAHSNEFLFVVGLIKPKEKQNRTFYNIKPRGWLIVSVLKNEGELE